MMKTSQKLIVSLLILTLVLSIISITLNVFVLKIGEFNKTEIDFVETNSNQGNVQLVIEGSSPNSGENYG
ncbi:hypothetical protein EXS72_01400 [Candidatus Pacearchaeota archaeon]|nr:hypothetical protein [Candidatus Pacearchaeota archaeon]